MTVACAIVPEIVGVTKSNRCAWEAMKWYRQAADQGHAKARVNTGP